MNDSVVVLLILANAPVAARLPQRCSALGRRGPKQEKSSRPAAEKGVLRSSTRGCMYVCMGGWVCRPFRRHVQERCWFLLIRVPALSCVSSSDCGAEERRTRPGGMFAVPFVHNQPVRFPNLCAWGVTACHCLMVKSVFTVHDSNLLCPVG